MSLTLDLDNNGNLIVTTPLAAAAGMRQSSFTLSGLGISEKRDAQALQVLIKVLTRQKKSQEARTVGTEGSPNVSMIYEWMKAHPEAYQAKSTSEKKLEDLGL